MDSEKGNFLAGGNEVGALMRAYDWSASPLGPVENWPQGLKTAIRIMLTSRYAMWLGWGDELVFLYNDSYARMTLGAKHPWALGKPAQVVWAEIWTDIGPRIAQVLESGEATWDEALLLFLERSGYPEETYHTFSYSPLSDDTGKIAGMFCVVTEETERVIGERRLSVLREVGSALAAASTQEEIFAAVGQCIESQPQDLPFTLTYLFEAEGDIARLITTTGVPEDHPIAVATLQSADPGLPWPVESVLKQSAPVLVEDLADHFPHIPAGPWDKSPRQAIVVPLAQQGQDRPAGFIVAGLNPYREFDNEYRGFIRILTGQIAASLSNAQAYEQERKRAEALSELDRAKTTFFSNISHEFRTPLTLMLGPIEDALADSSVALPALQRERLEIAHRNTVRLLKLANNLLDFTRIEAGRMQASFQPTDLATLTTDLASSFRSAMERAGLQYEVQCPPLPEPVYVDHDMWEKIVLNLLSNAFKYTLEGTVSVFLTVSNGHVEFLVQDTGMGIPEKDLPHVFERFHRVEGARGRTHEGTGIGLALIQELVKLHGGEVRVQSAYGQGTTFTVALPFGTAHLPAERVVEVSSENSARASTALSADAYAREALRLLPEQSANEMGTLPEESQERADATLGKKESESASLARVVVADDNADMRAYITRLLGEWYDVEAATNGREVLEAVRRERPDLVLSDVMMPEMDGFELVAALRSDTDTSTIPIILLSARAGEDAWLEGIHAGADDYLIKPFSKRELQARVSSLLQLVQVRRQASEAAERFRVAFEHAAVGLSITDPNGRFQEVNPAFCRTVGYSEEDLLALDIGALIDPADQDENRRLLDQLLQGEIPSLVIEKRFIRKDGSAVWMQNSVSIIRDDHGQPVRIITLSEDISERVLVRQEREQLIETLERERARLTELFMQAPAFIAVLRGPEHVFELSNPPYYQLIGHREVIGKTVRDVFPDLAGQGFFEILDEVYATGKPFIGNDVRVVLHPKPYGPQEERFLDFVYQPLHAADGSVSGILTHGVDLTQRKRAEQERERLLALESAAREELQAQQERQEVLVRHLRAANRVASELIKSTAQPDMLRSVLDMLSTDFRASMCGIWLTTHNGLRLTLADQIGLNAAPTRVLEPEVVINLDPYKLGWIARFKRAFVSNDISSDMHFDASWVTKHKIVGAAVFPLVHQTRLLGIMAAFFEEELPLEASAILSTLASVLSVSMANLPGEKEQTNPV